MKETAAGALARTLTPNNGARIIAARECTRPGYATRLIVLAEYENQFCTWEYSPETHNCYGGSYFGNDIAAAARDYDLRDKPQAPKPEPQNHVAVLVSVVDERIVSVEAFRSWEDAAGAFKEENGLSYEEYEQAEEVGDPGVLEISGTRIWWPLALPAV